MLLWQLHHIALARRTATLEPRTKLPQMALEEVRTARRQIHNTTGNSTSVITISILASSSPPLRNTIFIYKWVPHIHIYLYTQDHHPRRRKPKLRLATLFYWIWKVRQLSRSLRTAKAFKSSRTLPPEAQKTQNQPIPKRP